MLDDPTLNVLNKTSGSLPKTKKKKAKEKLCMKPLRDQPRNIDTSQPMSFKRSLQVSTYWLLQRQGSAMRTMMKPGSMMNLVRGGLRSRGEG